MRNLIENTIYDTSAEYIRDLKAISALMPCSATIVKHIADSSEVSGFYRNQLQEEKLKAALMKKDSWRTAIETAEEHPYFAGQIDFLLDFSGAKINIPDSSGDDRILLLFREYYEKANAVFGSQGVKIEEGLWRRALLCMGNYSLMERSNTSFVVNGKDRDISWKRLLRDSSPGRSYVKDLLEQLNPKDIIQGLNNVIDNYKDKITDWYRYFISYPEIMKNCGEKVFIRFSNAKDILLLLSSRTSGYCSEYYSYAFYCELRQNYPERHDIEYYPSQGQEAPKNFSIDNTENSEMPAIYIGFNRENGKWVSSTSENEHLQTYEDKDLLIAYLVKEKYIAN
jgi:hypothetical protein